MPLTYRWADDQLLDELLEQMVEGEGKGRLTPALVFCFNREECWSVAEQLKGKKLLRGDQQARISAALDEFDFSDGAGQNCDNYCCVVSAFITQVYCLNTAASWKRYSSGNYFPSLFIQTLSAGINLPARSVVLPSLMKGPHGDMKLLDPSSAHQMFGRAGRPQYDTRGFVFALAK